MTEFLQYLTRWEIVATVALLGLVAVVAFKLLLATAYQVRLARANRGAKTLTVYLDSGECLRMDVKSFTIEHDGAGKITSFKWVDTHSQRRLLFARLTGILAVVEEPHRA